MNIAICDNEAYHLTAIEKALNSRITHWNGTAKITFYYSGETLLAASSTISFDLIFLDIEMPGLNGLKTAETLRKNQSKAILIYITSHPQYAIDAYRVRPLRFLTKPIQAMVFDEMWAAVLAEYQTRHHRIELPIGKKSFFCEIHEICYIKSERNHVTVHLRDASIIPSVNLRLSKIEKMLSISTFFQCSRGILVSFKYIINYNEHSLTLENGEILPISKRRYQDFSIARREYLRQEVLK
jgi:DNA-binding LytR/AlgR family response regulator